MNFVEYCLTDSRQDFELYDGFQFFSEIENAFISGFLQGDCLKTAVFDMPLYCWLPFDVNFSFCGDGGECRCDQSDCFCSKDSDNRVNGSFDCYFNSSYSFFNDCGYYENVCYFDCRNNVGKGVKWLDNNNIIADRNENGNYGRGKNINSDNANGQQSWSNYEKNGELFSSCEISLIRCDFSPLAFNDYDDGYFIAPLVFTADSGRRFNAPLLASECGRVCFGISLLSNVCRDKDLNKFMTYDVCREKNSSKFLTLSEYEENSSHKLGDLPVFVQGDFNSDLISYVYRKKKYDILFSSLICTEDSLISYRQSDEFKGFDGVSEKAVDCAGINGFRGDLQRQFSLFVKDAAEKDLTFSKAFEPDLRFFRQSRCIGAEFKFFDNKADEKFGHFDSDNFIIDKDEKNLGQDVIAKEKNIIGGKDLLLTEMKDYFSLRLTALVDYRLKDFETDGIIRFSDCSNFLFADRNRLFEKILETVSAGVNNNKKYEGHWNELPAALENAVSRDGEHESGKLSLWENELHILPEEIRKIRQASLSEYCGEPVKAEIKVDMSGMKNIINKQTDIDNVVTLLTAAVGEAVTAAAEGVHDL